ncbi:hypothetical protein [Methylosinus sp. LW3]|uniref:hypothetical protein n=1 Tax=Methylosinus sp. LW3 TaxID=107635 RepID=UPI0004B1B10E|nr:hypothetical protein [Methylosinus sp. LW3]
MSTVVRLSLICASALVIGALGADAAVAKEKRCRQVCEDRTEYEPQYEQPTCEHRTSYVRRIVERRTVYVAQPEVVATPVIAYPAYSYGYGYPYGYSGYGGGYGAGYGLIGASFSGWGWGW